MSMVISVQLIAYALALFIALGIIFIGIREWFQPSIAARGFGVPLVAPADRDFLAIKASRDIASGAVILTLLTIGDHRAVASFSFTAIFCRWLIRAPSLHGCACCSATTGSSTPRSRSVDRNMCCDISAPTRSKGVER
jgi:hypothetical protein